MWRNLEIQDGGPRWQTFRNHDDCCSFPILGVKEGFKGRGWGGGMASGAPAQSQSVKKSLVWIGLIYLSCSIPTVICYL